VFVRTERQRRYKGKPLFELGLPKRPVPCWRIRLVKKGISAAKEYRRFDTGDYNSKLVNVCRRTSCLQITVSCRVVIARQPEWRP